MTSVTGKRSPLVIASLLLLTSCVPRSGPPPPELAAAQSVRIPIPADIGSLDPAQIGDPLDYSIGDNVFDGLYRIDDHLHQVPDLAMGAPSVSPDGRVYTFHLRSEAIFWNGDPVTASDFVYSWNRAAAAGGAYANASLNGNVFAPIVGDSAVVDAINSNRAAPALSGLYAPDDHTLVVTLSAPTGYFLSTLAVPSTWVVDPKVIRDRGEDTWWTTSEGLVGTGPFRMTSRDRDHGAAFTPVTSWWKGSTGFLKRLEFEIEPTVAGMLSGFFAGRYDIVGYADQPPDLPLASAAKGLQSDSRYSADIRTWVYARTEWVGFNAASGPFAGVDSGRDGRLALSLAIDRQALMNAVCQGGTMCVAATGGLITKGLYGYLGEGADPNARFDPSRARALLASWDPDGSRLRGLVYAYPKAPFWRNVAENLQAQWKANLRVDVALREQDISTFFYRRTAGDYSIFRGSWLADYDHPQDWFDNLFVSNGAAGSGDLGPAFDTLLARADSTSGGAALADYQALSRMLIDKAMFAALFYYVRTVLVQPYVQGYGGNPIYEFDWTDMKVLKH